MGPVWSLDDEANLEALFCIGHSGFALFSGMDTDHALAHNRIVARQDELLAFLNANQESPLVVEFLGEAGMSDFFRRDDDGQIKGTGYFYKLSYSSEDNLWHVMPCV